MSLQAIARWGRPLLLSFLVLANIAPVRAADRASLEAAIVYNILLFVQWPGEESLPAGAPFVLCASSSSPIYQAARSLEGRPLRRMKLSVQPFESSDVRCKAIYVDSAAGVKAVEGGVAGVGFEPVLVIGGSGFSIAETATVQLLHQQGRLAFDISQRKARKVGLKVSSKLLSLARKVVE